jgi:hypothetical protein
MLLKELFILFKNILANLILEFILKLYIYFLISFKKLIILL